ncbi:MAG: hypothetical protein JW771_03415 [Candidatus Thermoplasmatota archaeon]|nr:hypothetical protein [Candidatus Thermoplasmatota archaeon]
MFKREENKKLCEEVLYEVVKRYKIESNELSVMSDHTCPIDDIRSVEEVMFPSKHLQRYEKYRRLFHWQRNGK